jgi:MoaA/NifB/PqqE/SkfB family radical SAM enzyme
VEWLEERTAELRERAGWRVPVSVFGAKPEERAIERLRSVGVDRCIFRLDSEEPEDVERRLDELAGLVP